MENLLMFRVKIIKNGIQTHGAQFNTQAEADAWIAEGSARQWWGKPAYTEVVQPRITEQQEVVITPEVRDEDGNVITPAVTEMQEIVVQEEVTIEHPAEFEVQIEDVTAEVEYQKQVDKNLRRIQFGQRLMAELAASNQKDIASGVLTIQQVIEAEAALATVQRLVMNGSLGLAKAALEQTTVPHLSEKKKVYFINLISEYLKNES
jgi:hypothetical protein